MVPSVALPTEPCPRVAHAARGIHGELPRQAFRVDGFWGMHLYRYSARVRMDGVPIAIEPGHGGFTPPGVEMAYEFRGPSVHVFTHLEWPAEAAALTSLPAMFPVGPEFPVLWERMESIIGWVHTDPRRANVRAWDVLLSLVSTAQAGREEALPPAVREALRIIELRLEEPLSVEAIAREVCVSHSHLTRLFRATLGDTVVGTIQSRRVERARHLLRFTTLPVKEVATLVGLPDLQQFNKTIRKRLGVAPSRLRAFDGTEGASH